ncbi:MAG: LacI family DNA-binding transcriptional regulator [Lachnospiraceae bacterium]
MKATIKDIAEKLGVSPGTVSKGLNGGRDISEQLRTAILETAVEMGYQGRARKGGRQYLAVFIENMKADSPDDFGYDIIMGFRKAAYAGEWDVEVIPVTPAFQSENLYEHLMLQNGYKGSYFLGFSLEDPWMVQIQQTGYPTVLLDNEAVSPNVSSVGTDTQEAVDSAISHLITLGHEKIGFLDGSTGSMISDQRMAAYLLSMKKHNLPIDPNLAVYSYFTADAAHYHVPGMLELGATAILCGNDLIAQGVIESCRSCGMEVPGDVSVIGYDDLPVAGKMTPPLTTIRQDRTALGKSGFFALYSMMSGTSVSKTLLHPQLVVRKSTAVSKPRLVTRRNIDTDCVLYKNPLLYERYS